jgi:membrane protease YdiL (CAAX protease family)
MDTTSKASNGRLSSFLRQYQLIIFFVLTLTLGAGVVTVAVMTGNENIAILAVLTPSLTAIALTALVSGKVGLRELLVKQTKQRVNFRWIVISLFTIPLIAAVAISLHSLFGGPALTLRSTQLLPQVIIILLISFGEEYGWRGYALPRLQQRYIALAASLILGLVHGFWHFPGFLIGQGTPEEMPFYVFMLWVFALTILITWVYNNTRSVLMAILMHSAANVTFAYLPLTPSAAGGIPTFWLFLGLLWLVTVVVIIVFGPTTLIRKPAAQLEI